VQEGAGTWLSTQLLVPPNLRVLHPRLPLLRAQMLRHEKQVHRWPTKLNEVGQRRIVEHVNTTASPVPQWLQLLTSQASYHILPWTHFDQPLA
jgi:hypothetical protein